MTNIKFIFYLPMWFILISCTQLIPPTTIGEDSVSGTTTPPTILITPTNTLEATETATSVPKPSISPIVTPTLPPPTATPQIVGRWQCHPDGGIACFNTISVASILNQEVGWAFSYKGVVLQYAKLRGDATPTWQRITSLNVRDRGINDVEMVNPDEGWGLDGGWIFHYQKGSVNYVNSSYGTLLDIKMLTPEEGWIVGAYGVLLHYSDGEWQPFPQAIDHDKDLLSIDMINHERGGSWGGQGFLWYRDGQWIEDESAPGGFYHQTELVSEDEGWFVGNGFPVNLLHYYQGTWEKIIAPEVDKLNRVAMTSAEEGWGVGKGGLIMHYLYGQWQQVDSPTKNELVAIRMVSADEGWAFGENSTILHYFQNEWRLVDEGKRIPAFLNDIALIDEDEWWAVGSVGLIHHRGGEWEVVDNPITDSEERIALTSIDMVNAQEGWAVGRQGTILHNIQGNWESVPIFVLSESSKNLNLNAIDMVNENEGWAVGSENFKFYNEGAILHYMDDKWQEVHSPTENLLKDIDMIDEDEGWAIGAKGTILHYQGGSWMLVPAEIETKLIEINMLNASEGWILGEKNVILRYQDGKWYPVEYPLPYTLRAMNMLSADEGWFSSYAGGLVHYQNGEWEWLNDFQWAGIRKIEMLDEYTGWAVGDGILHYTNQ